jgi:hypothetical protein
MCKAVAVSEENLVMRVLNLLFLVACLFGIDTYAQLDTSFGSGGRLQPGGPLVRSSKIAIQPDNSALITAGCSGDIFFTPPRICLWKISEDGSVAFYRSTAVPGLTQSGRPWSNGIAYQSDGKIVVVGALTDGSRNESLLIRYNADGTLDTSFGTDGFVINQPTGARAFNGIVVQDDGKLVVSGTTSTTEIVTRFDQNGLVDPTFGQGGIVSGAGNEIVMMPDARLLAVGSGQMLSRLNSDGSFDTTFGDGDGQVSIGITGKLVDFQADGRVLVLSGSRSVHRYNRDGSPDLTFNGTGSVTFYDADHTVTGMSVMPSGKITVAAFRSLLQSGPSLDFRIARLLANGAPDPTFNSTGFMSVDFSGWDDGTDSVKYDRLGRTLIGGFTGQPTGFPYQFATMAAARLVGPAIQPVRFSGRVVRANGMAVSGATITLSNGKNPIGTARSNHSGFFTFLNIPTGDTYTVSARSKVAKFRQYNILVDDTINNFIFAAQSQ